MELIVPPETGELFPTLGDQMCDFLEERACHGPGDVKGQPITLAEDWRYVLYRLYEVWPKGHPRAGKRRFKRGAVSWRKGSAKCLSPDTRVSMADGSVRRADNLRPGDEVLGWDGIVRPARVAAVQVQLPSPMTQITTERGRVLTVTGDHPVLTRGTLWRPGTPKRRRYASCDPHRDSVQWVKAEELAAGDRVVVGLGWCGSGDLACESAWILGAFCGDGSGNGRFCSADQEIIDRIGRSFPVTKCAGNNGYDHYARGSRPLLREHGMYASNARTKRVPPAVMSAGADAVTAFLAGYLDTDGWISYTPTDNGKTRIAVAWGSVNRDLLADCQHLLAGLGINAGLRSSVGTYKGQRHQAWALSVTDADQAAALARMLLQHMEHPAKRAKAEQVVAHVGRCVFGQRDTDKVTSVRQLPAATSIALEVDEVHTHITAGIVTHNTEFMALVAFAELHPDAPVRFNGFDKDAPCGLAPGRPVTDPYIPLLANTKDQVEELAYGALKVICEECVDSDLFDAALDRILRIGENGRADGKAVALANAPNSNDGGRTTFQGYDETHRLYLPNHKAAIQTMEANLGKRAAQDPWSLSTTTAGEPGQSSQAEDDHFEAEAILRGEVQRPRMFYFHRQASDGWDLDKFEDRVEAIREASGPELAARTDLEDIAAQWDSPKADKTYLERVWTNRWTQQGASAFNVKRFKALGLPGEVIPRRAFVTLGFDGARFRDSTGLTLTDVKTGMQQKLFLSERPLSASEEWEVSESEVDAAVRQAFREYRVLLMYADPPYWNATVGDWSARYGDSKVTRRPIVQEFWTNKQERMIKAIQAYQDGIASGMLSHNESDDGDLVRHVGNAGKHFLKRVDPETGQLLWILGKLHKDRKFDLCMAAILSWQARMDVLKFLPKTTQRVVRVR